MHHDRDHRPPPNDGSRRDGGPSERRGPPDTSFLNLEMSKVMYEEARSLAKEAGRELLKEAIKAHLKERLAGQIEALARLAATEIAEDILTNLDIEARIAERRRAIGGLDARVSEALHKK